METTTKPTKISDQVDRLNKIYEMIETCKSRLSRRYTLCEERHGRGANGNIIGTEWDLGYVNKHESILKRLKAAYNNQLKNMKPYSI